VVEFDENLRRVKVKIAYYGPAVGGKTTNIKVLHERAERSRRGDLVSVNSQQDRTIICDLLPLRTGGFRGLDLRLQLVAVPGQSIYGAPRRALLKGCDGFVFVANSAVDRWHETVQSYRELISNLLALQRDPSTVPLVFQYNKRDLLKVMEIGTLERALNARGAPSFPAVAREGQGVLETLSAILTRTLEELSRRYPVIEMTPGQTVAAWTAKALHGIYGRARLDDRPDEPLPPEPPPAEPEDFATAEPAQYLKLQIAMAEETSRPPGVAGELRSAESLAESYAEASAELGSVVSDLREERERDHARLAEIRVALDLAEEGAGEMGLEDRAGRVLGIMMRAGDASNAALYFTAGEVPQVLVVQPLVADPLSRSRWGLAHLEQLRELREPKLETVSESPEFAEVLTLSDPAFEAVAIVPLRSAERFLGLALLYYRPHAALPPKDTLAHLGFLARVLVGPLEATAAREVAAGAREVAAGAERMRTLSRASAGAVASLLTRLPSSAARRQPVSLEDVITPLGAPGVEVAVAPGTRPIEGDAALLRFALATLIHRCEAAALEMGQTPSIEVRAALEDFMVRVQVRGGRGGSRPSMVARAPGAAGFDADAEMTAVNAIVALHEGFFTAPEGEGADVQFTMLFNPL
jgi:signal recognition particle receptor subunit beta